MIRHTPEFDQRIADWLESDPNAAPPDVMSTVVAALPSIPQARRGPLAPRRFTFMQAYMRLAAVAAAVAVVGLGVFAYIGGQPNVGPTAAPTSRPTVLPSPSPAGAKFTSPLYFYTVDTPPGWTVVPATVEWPVGGVIDGAHGDWVDLFVMGDTTEDAVGYVAVAAQPISAISFPETWMSGYADRQAASEFACRGPADAWIDATVDGLSAPVRRIDVTCSGRMPSGEDATGRRSADVLFWDENTWIGYVMTGNPEAIDTLLAALRLPETETFTSPLYEYSVDVPVGWNVTPATTPWPEGVEFAAAYADAFQGPEANPDFSDVYVAVQPVPEGTTDAAWTSEYATRLAASPRDCKGPADAWSDATVSGIPVRRIDLVCQGIRLSDIAFVFNQKGYVLTGNRQVIRLFMQTLESPG